LLKQKSLNNWTFFRCICKSIDFFFWTQATARQLKLAS
jgi:hypothetical protein